MKKYIFVWLLSFLLTPYILFQTVSIITKVTVTNIFRQFDELIILLGFALTISTVITCTKILVDKINSMSK